MNNLTEINLTELHGSIASGLKTKFPNCAVDYYSRPGEKIITPAIFFELENGIPANPHDTGTGQLEIELKFSAEVIVAYKQGGLLGVRALALALARFVHGNRWGQPVGRGQFSEAIPETFSSPMDAYESWRVSWSHTAFLGNNIWEEDGNVPKQILVSTAPRIGIPHEPDYVAVTDGMGALP
jgi:hypothetical protein